MLGLKIQARPGKLSGAVVLSSSLVVITMFGGCRETHEAISDACGGLASLVLAGRWQAEPSPNEEVNDTLPADELPLFLFPAGDLVRGNRKGTWKVVSCKGLVVLLELPRREQTDACSLFVQNELEPEFVSGKLVCGGTTTAVKRTEAIGALASEALENSIESRLSKERCAEKLAQATTWKRRWLRLWCGEGGEEGWVRRFL